MHESCLAMLEMAKCCSTEYITSSRMVSSKPCFVFLAVVTPDAPENGSIAYLRNGETSNAEILFNFQGQYAHPSHAGCIPVYFNKGLYFEKSTNCKGITIQYYVEDKKKS